MTDISIIIINWNTRQMLLDCIASIYETVRKTSFELFVVDNGSADGSVDAVERYFPSVKVIANNSNEGFARANNYALRIMHGRYAVLLNSDTLAREGSIERLISFMDSHSDVGICGSQLLNPDGSKQTSYGRFPTIISEFASKGILRFFAPNAYRNLFTFKYGKGERPLSVDFINGACMVVRREAIAQVGLLDEDYFFFYEEIDWCRRIKDAGWLVYNVPDAAIVHFGGVSTKELSLRARAESWRSRYLYFKKSLRLGAVGTFLLYGLGFIHLMYRLMGYLLMNIITFFSIRRLRNRLKIFGYLFLWHIRGMPVDMCLPRKS